MADPAPMFFEDAPLFYDGLPVVCGGDHCCGDVGAYLDPCASFSWPNLTMATVRPSWDNLGTCLNQNGTACADLGTEITLPKFGQTFTQIFFALPTPQPVLGPYKIKCNSNDFNAGYWSVELQPVCDNGVPFFYIFSKLGSSFNTKIILSSQRFSGRVISGVPYALEATTGVGSDSPNFVYCRCTGATVTFG